MTFRRLASIVLLLGLFVGSSSAFAHHGNAAFDSSRKVTVKGTVVGWLWANPHCVLTFEAKDDKGETVRWAAEANVPSDMAKRGWSRSTFSPGDQVTVTMTPARNGRPVGRMEQVMLASGQVLTSAVPPDSPSGPAQ